MKTLEMGMNEKQKLGVKIAAEMLGEEAGESIEGAINAKHFGAKLSNIALNQVFAERWGNTTIDRRSRSLVTLGILMALRQYNELRYHFKAAVNHGLTVAEIEEIILQGAAYAGYPAASLASRAARDELESMGLGAQLENVA